VSVRHHISKTRSWPLIGCIAAAVRVFEGHDVADFLVRGPPFLDVVVHVSEQAEFLVE
jgi:hypothetical protein